MTNKISEHKDLLLFEDYFFKELHNSPNGDFLKQEEKLKNIITTCTAKVVKETDSKKENYKRTIASLILENDNEKKYFGEELDNGLQQILSSLNFYVDALKHPNNEAVELKKTFLDKITKLGQEAALLSNNISNSLVFSPLKGKSFMLSIQDLIKSISLKFNIPISAEFSSNFNGTLLSKTQKYQIYNMSKDILQHLMTVYNPESLTLKYSFKYRNNILQIDISMRGSALSQKNLEMQVAIGYNNLKHKLALLKAKLHKKEGNKLTIKIPISNKNKLHALV